LLLFLVLGGIGVGLLSIPGFETQQTPPPAAAPVATDEAQPRSGPSLIRPAAAADMPRVIAGMLIPETDKPALRQDVELGKLKLGWLTISDSHAEDGDWVEISAAGISQSVRLWHNPTTVAVAYSPGIHVKVTGTVDGDGQGITVAVHLGASSIALAPMTVGTSVQVPAP
jgi:hypothetical protein